MFCHVLLWYVVLCVQRRAALQGCDLGSSAMLCHDMCWNGTAMRGRLGDSRDNWGSGLVLAVLCYVTFGSGSLCDVMVRSAQSCYALCCHAMA
eukprot:9197439-Pyramimonas_sp.AAC.1